MTVESQLPTRRSAWVAFSWRMTGGGIGYLPSLSSMRVLRLLRSSR
jgi:hypothetical protein